MGMTNQERTEQNRKELKKIFEDLKREDEEARQTNDWSKVFVSGKKEYPDNKEATAKVANQMTELLESLKNDLKNMLNKNN